MVGAGFAGVGAAVMLRRAGYHDVTVFERGERVGGVWHHNTYPGAACDVPSHLYEFSFEPNPRWSRRYAPQAEIQAYLEDVARRHGVLDRIRTNTEVKQARWDAEGEKWVLETSAGEHEAEVLITACGQLSVPKVPPIPGLESFDGPAFHTARWRDDVDLAGRRVAVVGAGCSAIQTVPAIQPIVEHVDVYQRSPGWTFPKMDFAYKERTKRLFERYPVLQRLDRAAVFAFMEYGAAAMTSRRCAARPLPRRGPHADQEGDQGPRAAPQGDPERRDRLQADHAHGRVVSDADPAERRARHRSDRGGDAFRDPHRRRNRATRRRARAGHRLPVARVRRRRWRSSAPASRTLAEEWAEVPRAYLGMSVPGFPNMFLLYGPNTNGGTGSVIYTIEAGINHVIAALGELERADARRIEVRRDAAERFDRELRAALAESVWHTGCTSWYVDENGNDPSQWPWLWSTYRRRTASIEPGAYELSAPTPERAEGGRIGLGGAFDQPVGGRDRRSSAHARRISSTSPNSWRR